MFRKGTLACLCDVITQTLRVSVGGKAAEKISVSYHFVIWSMQTSVSTRFYVVPTQGMLTFLGGYLDPHYGQTRLI